MTCLRESNEKWFHDNGLKLVDASTSQSISRDAGDAGQSTRCSMSIATRNDFDWVHEMASMNLAINSKMNGLRSFSRNQERPAFLQKSSRRTCPHSKRHTFAKWHAFAMQFSQWTLPWTDLSIGMLIRAIAPVFAEKSGNMWTDKILSFSGRSEFYSPFATLWKGFEFFLVFTWKRKKVKTATKDPPQSELEPSTPR